MEYQSTKQVKNNNLHRQSPMNLILMDYQQIITALLVNEIFF